jgi:hypothetical protein
MGRQQIFYRLPSDLQRTILTFINNEKHVLARLLLQNKRLITCLTYAQHQQLLISYWSAILALGVVDETIQTAAINDHDAHYQYCERLLGEDVYDHLTPFQTLAKILAKIIYIPK